MFAMSKHCRYCAMADQMMKEQSREIDIWQWRNLVLSTNIAEALQEIQDLQEGLEPNEATDTILSLQHELLQKRNVVRQEFDEKVLPVSFGLGILSEIGDIFLIFFEIKYEISLNLPLL